jgi:hypothetical protein
MRDIAFLNELPCPVGAFIPRLLPNVYNDVGRVCYMPPDIRDMKGRKQKDLLWQKRVYKDPFGYKEMKRLYRMLDELLRVPVSRKTRSHRPQRGGMGGSSVQQLCIVKARIGNTMEAHRKFLLQYLPQENKSQVKEKPRLFGNTGEEDPAGDYQAGMTGRHFKFIVSPENQKVDAEALVRTLVKRIEAATGYKFYWTAVVHTDTAHKHAHLLINGKDRSGKDVYFEPSFIKGTMREMTREICTAMIGRRTQEEIRQYQEQAYKALRYTAVDEDLKKFERPYEGQDPKHESRVDAQEDIHYKRLAFLTGLGLAEQDETNRRRFYLEKGWRNKLKTQGRYNFFLSARQDLMYTSPYQLEQYEGDGGPVEGVVTKLYKMNDEDRWNHAMVIESRQEGRSWYVPLYYEPRDELLGRTIRCRTKKNERGQLRPIIQTIEGPMNLPEKLH